MSCPNPDCGSDDVRRGEQGALKDTYVCNRCETTYRRLNGGAVRWGITAFVALTTGIIIT